MLYSNVYKVIQNFTQKNSKNLLKNIFNKKKNDNTEQYHPKISKSMEFYGISYNIP